MKRILIIVLCLLLALPLCALAEPAVPEALDMSILCENRAYQFDFLPWFSTPEAAQEAFAGVDIQRINIDGNLTLVEFTYPSGLTGGEGRMRLIYRLINEELALTEIRFTEMLADDAAAAAYIDTLSSRYEDIYERKVLGMEYRTLLKLRDCLEEEHMSDGKYHVGMGVYSGREFIAPDGADYATAMRVELDPAERRRVYLPGEGEYFVSYKIGLAKNESTTSSGKSYSSVGALYGY